MFISEMGSRIRIKDGILKHRETYQIMTPETIGLQKDSEWHVHDNSLQPTTNMIDFASHKRAVSVFWLWKGSSLLVWDIQEA
jgi:hypothetical protein